MVGRPVEAAINLREEHAEVIRKVVDKPELLHDVDWDGTDSAIEVIESKEEAVVSKTARTAAPADPSAAREMLDSH